ncbi:MAG: helix-turn-helix domain-containing protein [Sandaracinaceae bacterium]|nr:helix-turn-helix domain-containing protein [Sandaracinaceae bacterium]
MLEASLWVGPLVSIWIVAEGVARLGSFDWVVVFGTVSAFSLGGVGWQLALRGLKSDMALGRAFAWLVWLAWLGAWGILFETEAYCATARLGLSAVSVEAGPGWVRLGLGMALVESALSVPEGGLRLPRILGFSGTWLIRLFSLFFGVSGIAIEGLRHTGPIEISEDVLLISPRSGLFTEAGAFGLPLLAIWIRWRRDGLGLGPFARASNRWVRRGLLGYVSFLALSLAVASLDEAGYRIRPLAFFGALLSLLGGHWMAAVEPSSAVRVLRWAREAVAGFCAWILASLFIWMRLPSALADFEHGLLRTAISIAAFAWMHRPLARFFEWLLAPDRGRLLRAIEEAQKNLSCGASSIEEALRAISTPIEKAYGKPNRPCRLMLVEPALDFFLDRHGQIQVRKGQALDPFRQWMLSSAPQVLSLSELMHRSVKQEKWRLLYLAMEEMGLDALLPLYTLSPEPMCHGLLGIALAKGRPPLSAEEVVALEGFAKVVTSCLVPILRVEELRKQLGELHLKLIDAQKRLEELDCEHGRESNEVNQDFAPPSPIEAHSASTRAAISALELAARRDHPLLMVVERGSDPLPWIEYLRRQGAQHRRAPVFFQCASFVGEKAKEALLEALLASGRALLLLFDILALPPSAQAMLFDVLKSRVVPSTPSNQPLLCRVVALTSVWPPPPGMPEPFHPDLAHLLEAHRITIPPLRERLADLPPMVLRLIDRLCRIQGKATLGIEEEAMQWLIGHGLEQGEAGLEALLAHAIKTAVPPRISCADLKRAFEAFPQPHPLEGRLAEIESRAIRRAIALAGGRLGKAARRLGLERKALLDRIRALGISPEDLEGLCFSRKSSQR